MKPQRRRYATPDQMRTLVDAAHGALQAIGEKVGGITLAPDGTVTILTQAPAAPADLFSALEHKL